MRANEYDVTELSDNELAKSHLRHLGGGRANVADERLIRFEFPERPGALMNFLTRLGNRWNISLFHYRNHGAAYGRVLVGLQATKEERKAIEVFLEKLAYPYHEESDNLAYQQFLS